MKGPGSRLRPLDDLSKRPIVHMVTIPLFVVSPGGESFGARSHRLFVLRKGRRLQLFDRRYNCVSCKTAGAADFTRIDNFGTT